MTTKEKERLAGFEAAKKIALTITSNQRQRAQINGAPTNYAGANVNGRMFVICDTEYDIQNPDAYILGKPAREVYGEFSTMSK